MGPRSTREVSPLAMNRSFYPAAPQNIRSDASEVATNTILAVIVSFMIELSTRLRYALPAGDWQCFVLVILTGLASVRGWIAFATTWPGINSKKVSAMRRPVLSGTQRSEPLRQGMERNQSSISVYGSAVGRFIQPLGNLV